MTDSKRIKLLFGCYAAPRVRIGSKLVDEVRGLEVDVAGFSSAPIPWPYTHTPRPSLIVCRALARAIRLEAAAAVAHHFGVSINAVRLWRRALGVGRNTEGTRRLRRIIAKL